MPIVITTPNTDALSATSTVPHFVREVWADEIIKAAKFAEVLLPLINRSWQSMLSKGDVLHLGRLSNLGTSNIPADGSDLTFEAPQESKQDLVVDQQKYAAIMVGSITEVQSHIDVLGQYTSQLGYALTRVKEVLVANQFQNLSANVVGTLGVELTSDDYLSAWQKLKEAGIFEGSTAPGSEFNIALSPAAYAAALKVDVFANKQYNGSANTVQGVAVGNIYGFDVNISNLLRVPAANQHECVAMHRDCYAFVEQEGQRVESDRLVQKLVDIAVAWSVYGVAEVNFPPEAAPGSTTYTAVDNRGVLLRTV